MKRSALFALISTLAIGLLFVTGCGKKDTKDESTPPTAITNNTQGSQAAASTSQNVDTALGSGQTFDSLGSVGLSSTVAAPEFRFAEALQARSSSSAQAGIFSAPSQTSFVKQCESGSVSFNGTIDTGIGGTSSGLFTFANCLNDGSLYNGPMQMELSMSTTAVITMNMTLGGTSGLFSITDTGTNKVSTMSNFALILSTRDMRTKTLAASGDMNVKDASGNSVTVSFTNNYTQKVAGDMDNSGIGTRNITTNGTVTETRGAKSVTTTFDNLKIDVTGTAAYEDTSVNGAFTVTFNPANCFNGTFSLVTNTPVRYDKNAGKTIAGEMIINSATTMQFKADGSVDVITAGATTNYASTENLDGVCPI